MRVERAGLLADADHLRDHVREDFGRFQRFDEALAALDARSGSCKIASSRTTLPAVRAVMSSDWRMGTPEESSVESVREKRAMAILRRILPMIGSFSTIWSMRLRPPGVL